MEYLKKFFQKVRTLPADKIDTAPLDPQKVSGQVAAEQIRNITVGTAQSTGLERSHNEDALFVMQGSSAGEESLPNFGLFIVADGMGGHRAGEIASAISVRKVAQRITQDTVLRLFDPENSNDLPPLHEMVRKALEDANEAVVERVPGGGTTLTAAILLGHQVTIGHVGDSRAYIISDNGTSKTRKVTMNHPIFNSIIKFIVFNI